MGNGHLGNKPDSKPTNTSKIERLRKSIAWLPEDLHLSTPLENETKSGLPLEEVEKNPICFPIFSWSLILVGFSMLITVIIIMGQLIIDWMQGSLNNVSKQPFAMAKTNCT